MNANRSMDDLKSAQFYLTKAIDAERAMLPVFLTDGKAALDAIFDELDATYRNRVCIGVQKATDTAQRNGWSGRAVSALSRTKLFLRATAKAHVHEYFPDKTGAASRKIDRLHDITRVLTVSQHFEHAHLGAFRAELEALRDEGESILGAASASISGQKGEVAKLRELKERWEVQYQRLRFLFRGHFYGTSTDYTNYFDEKRNSKTAQEEIATTNEGTDDGAPLTVAA